MLSLRNQAKDMFVLAVGMPRHVVGVPREQVLTERTLQLQRAATVIARAQSGPSRQVYLEPSDADLDAMARRVAFELSVDLPQGVS